MRSWIFSIITPVFSVTWSSELILIGWFSAQEAVTDILYAFLGGKCGYVGRGVPAFMEVLEEDLLGMLPSSIHILKRAADRGRLNRAAIVLQTRERSHICHDESFSERCDISETLTWGLLTVKDSSTWNEQCAILYSTSMLKTHMKDSHMCWEEHESERRIE